ncbi:MAG: hypothetical protein RBJ76_21740 [Stenomitos frigidus ULC029]
MFESLISISGVIQLTIRSEQTAEKPWSIAKIADSRSSESLYGGNIDTINLSHRCYMSDRRFGKMPSWRNDRSINGKFKRFFCNLHFSYGSDRLLRKCWGDRTVFNGATVPLFRTGDSG